MKLLVFFLFVAYSIADVVVYDKCYFKGNALQLNNGKFPVLAKRVFSVEVDEMFRAEFWSGKNYTGYKLTLNANVECLNYSDIWYCPQCCPCTWGGFISSARVSHFSFNENTTKQPLQDNINDYFYIIAIVSALIVECVIIYCLVRCRKRRHYKKMKSDEIVDVREKFKLDEEDNISLDEDE